MKRLYRIEKNKLIGGVCGGLAEYFMIDPVIVRVLFIVLFFGWGISLLAYIILWIVAPKKSQIIDHIDMKLDNNTTSDEGNDIELDEDGQRRLNNQRLFGGVILITIGSLWLLDSIFDFFDFSILFPVIIILIGIFILINSKISRISTKPHNNINY